MPNGPISIDWRRVMAPDSPSAEVELLGSSPSFVTPQRATATQIDADGASDDDEGDPSEFNNYTDQELQEKIKRNRAPLKFPLPDGGEKRGKFVRRMEKELTRRLTDGPRKVDTARRPPARVDPYASSHPSADKGYKLNRDNITGKYRLNSNSPRTENYGQVEKSAFSKEVNCFIPGKRARVKEDGQSARTLDLTVCSKKRQKDNSIDSKETSGSSTKRWDHSKDQTFESKRSYNSNKSEEMKEVVHLDDEDTEPAKSVVSEMASKRDDSKIYYPSRSDPGAVELTHSLVKCLQPPEYLNSTVVNFYIQYLKKSRPREDLHFFSTYFYRKLEEALSETDASASQFSKLRGWWKGVDIFKKSYIILPIHGQLHWSLVIICMPSKDTESKPMIIHLDSLGLHSSNDVFIVIRSFLKSEWLHLQNDSYDIPFSRWIWKRLSRNIDEQKVDVPRQRNEYDCGVFMLYFIDRFIQEAPERLSKDSLDKVGMFGRSWFKAEEAAGLRVRIQALVEDVFESATVEDGKSGTESDSLDHSEGKGEDEDDGTIMIID